MLDRFAVVVATAALICVAISETVPNSVCGGSHTVTGETTVSIHNKRDQSGEWVTTISSYHNSESTSNDTKLEVKRRIINCGGKDIVHVEACIKGSTEAPVDGDTPLLFHEKGGKNAVVNSDRKTVSRSNPENEYGYGAVLTDRTLKDDELFEVVLEKMTDKYGSSLGIGVSNHSPTNIQYLDWIKSGAIMLYGSTVYRDGASINTSYGSNLDNLKVGARVGVMKKATGDLHFFVNGIDQGVALSNLTFSVYGVLDVYGKNVQARLSVK